MMRSVNDGGQDTLPAISYNLCPSYNYLFPYCAPYCDVNEDSGVKSNYSSERAGELTFSLKSFRGLQGDPGCSLLKILLKYLFARLSGI